MKTRLYRVEERRPLRPRDRKVWIHVFLTPAENADEALARVREKFDHDGRGKWTVEQMTSLIHQAGLYSSDATNTEKIARDAMPKRERRIRS